MGEILIILKLRFNNNDALLLKQSTISRWINFQLQFATVINNTEKATG